MEHAIYQAIGNPDKSQALVALQNEVGESRQCKGLLYLGHRFNGVVVYVILDVQMAIAKPNSSLVSTLSRAYGAESWLGLSADEVTNAYLIRVYLGSVFLGKLGEDTECLRLVVKVAGNELDDVDA